MFARRHRHPAVAALVASMAVAASPVSAQSSDWFDTGGGGMRLVVEPPSAGAGTLRAMLELDLEPGWSTYWRDPGSSGIPPQVTVRPGAGLVDAQVRFPAPVWIDNPYGAYAGYYGSVKLPITMTRIADGAHDLVADVFLGICEDICIPVQATLEVTVEPANGSTLHAMRVARAHAALPGAPGPDFALADPPPAPAGGGYIAVAHEGKSGALNMFVHAEDRTPLKPPVVAMRGPGRTVFLIEPARDMTEARNIATVVTVTSATDSFEAEYLLKIAAP